MGYPSRATSSSPACPSAMAAQVPMESIYCVRTELEERLSPPPFASLGTLLSSHRGTTRVSLTALSFALIIAFSQQTPVTQAGPESAIPRPESLLPQNVGVGVPTDEAVTITFDAAMNPGTVESALQVLPASAGRAHLEREPGPGHRRPRAPVAHRRDVRGRGRRPATRTDGRALASATRYSFTTQTAPTVSDFQVRLATTCRRAGSMRAPRLTPGGGRSRPTR